MLNVTLNKADYALFISGIGILITFLGIVIAFLNVNRQRKATLKNEEAKFKRDHNLQTYNEFVEDRGQMPDA